jgi:hypothetical protein
MAKFNMNEAEESPRIDREKAEAKVQASLKPNAKKRIRVGKDTAIIFRTTQAKKAQILALADRIDLRPGRKASIAETIEIAIDALEEKLGSPKTRKAQSL